MAELKRRRELFAREYLKDLHGTKAALRAGYSAASAHTEASQLLAIPEVQERIAELALARNEKLEVEARDVVLELVRMLNSDPALVCNEDGTVKSIHDIPIDARRAIASFDVEELWHGRGEDRVQVGVLKKVRFWNKDRAAELLGRHLRLFVDRIEAKHEGTLNVLTGIPDDAERV